MEEIIEEKQKQGRDKLTSLYRVSRLDLINALLPYPRHAFALHTRPTTGQEKPEDTLHVLSHSVLLLPQLLLLEHVEKTRSTDPRNQARLPSLHLLCGLNGQAEMLAFHYRQEPDGGSHGYRC